MERFISTSVYKETGDSHIYKKKVCEDAVARSYNADRTVAAVVLCDGAGSCDHAREGAQERPVPMRVPRGPFGIPLPLMPGPKTLCELRAGT